MTEREDRLLELLILVGYSIVFPVNLAQRIGGIQTGIGMLCTVLFGMNM